MQLTDAQLLEGAKYLLAKYRATLGTPVFNAANSGAKENILLNLYVLEGLYEKAFPSDPGYDRIAMGC